MQVCATAVDEADQVCRGGDRMHAQRGVAHEGDMNLARPLVELIAIKPVGQVVLGQTRAVAERFAQGQPREEKFVI